MATGEQDVYRFNVRGSVICTAGSKFSKFPKTKLGKLTKDDELGSDQQQEYFIDRNPMIFHFILDFYETGELHLPKTLCAGSIRNELEFWEIQESLLGSCCWKTLYNDDEDCGAYAMIEDLDFKVKNENVMETDANYILKQEKKIRHKVWELLQKPTSSLLGKIWFIVVFLSVTLSILVFGLSTTNLYSSSKFAMQNASNIQNRALLFEDAFVRHWVIWTDFATNLILFLDFLLRLYSCPSKKEFACNLLNAIDLLVSIFIFHIVYREINPSTVHEEVVSGPSVFKYVYALRALRLFRLLMHTRGMKIIKLCIKANFIDFLFFVALFLTFACIFAAVIYFAELEKNNEFSDFFESIWWAIITISTVGYGDKVPESILGHVIGAMAAFAGILIVTIPIVVISTNYGSFYNCYKVHDKRKKTSLPDKAVSLPRCNEKPAENLNKY